MKGVKIGGSVRKESACNAGDLSWEDPMEEGMATHSSILAWRIAMDTRALAGCSPWGSKESDTTERLSPRLPVITWLVESVVDVINHLWW